MAEIKFEKKPPSKSLNSDTYYVFEATVEAGAMHHDIGEQVRAAAGGSSVDFIGTIQKPGLTLSSKLAGLWLVFKESTNTTSGSYAIVADLDDFHIDLLGADSLGPLAGMVPSDAGATLRIERVVYSHNLNPDLSGNTGKDLFGFGTDAAGAAHLDLDWQPGFGAGIVASCELSFAGYSTRFPLYYKVPSYSPMGTIAKVDDPKTLMDEAYAERDKAKAEFEAQVREKVVETAKAAGRRLAGKPEAPPKKLDVAQRRGSVSLDSVVATFKGMSIEIDVGAGISLGPLKGRLINLQIEFFLDGSRSPRFDFTGAGLAYQSPAISVAGALIKQAMPYKDGDENLTATALNGGLVLKTPALGFAGIASLAQIQVDHHDQLSLFVYAMFQSKTGITFLNIVTLNGAAVTFGYNRDFLVPSDTGDIASHPLIALVEAGGPPESEKDEKEEKGEDKPEGKSDQGGSADGESSGGESEKPKFDAGGDLNKLLGVLKAVKEYVPIKAHNIVAGVGVKANLVQLVDLFLMPVVSFNTSSGDASIQLYGTASMVLPKGADEKSTVLKLNAALAAEIPIKGDKPLMVGLAITDGSFVVRPELRLDGGLAFYRYKGVTLFTIGGYGPLYRGAKPGWPVAQAVSMSLNVSKDVSLKGSVYFSFLPDAITFGLDVQGSAKVGGDHFSVGASFDLGLNAMMMWAPFFYELEAHANFALSVAVSQTVGVGWLSHTFSMSHSFDLSAKLHLWGNEDEKLNGKAELEIHLLFTFHPTVEWGEPIGDFFPISWADFKKQFALHPEGQPDKLGSGQGQITDGVRDHFGTDKIAVVTAEHLAAEAKVFFPPTACTVNGESVVQWSANKVGIQMVGMVADDYWAPMAVRLHKGGVEVDRKGFAFEIINDEVPVALWKPSKHKGMADAPDPHGQQVLADVPVGLRIKSALSVEGASRAIDKQNLAFDIDEGVGIVTQTAQRVAVGSQTTEAAVVSAMTQHRPDPGVLAALGIDTPDVSFAPLKDTDLVGIPHLV